MKIFRAATALSLSLLLTGPVLVAQNCAPNAPMTNNEARKDAKTQAEMDHHADKAQAKADKANAKALGSHKVKKAAKKQDKANAEAGRVPPQ